MATLLHTLLSCDLVEFTSNFPDGYKTIRHITKNTASPITPAMAPQRQLARPIRLQSVSHTHVFDVSHIWDDSKISRVFMPQSTLKVKQV